MKSGRSGPRSKKGWPILSSISRVIEFYPCYPIPDAFPELQVAGHAGLVRSNVTNYNPSARIVVIGILLVTMHPALNLSVVVRLKQAMGLKDHHLNSLL